MLIQPFKQGLFWIAHTISMIEELNLVLWRIQNWTHFWQFFLVLLKSGLNLRNISLACQFGCYKVWMLNIKYLCWFSYRFFQLIKTNFKRLKPSYPNQLMRYRVHKLLKFKYSENATKIWKISHFILTLLSN